MRPVPQGTRPVDKRLQLARTVAETLKSLLRKKEDAMQRLYASAMILWLAASGAANAQTDPAQMNGAQTNPQIPPATESAVPATPPAPALQSVPASDPLSVPTSTVPTTF